MADNEKIWVIDDGEAPAVKNLGEPLAGTDRHGTPRSSRRDAKRTARQAAAARPAAVAAAGPVRRLHGAVRLGLVFALGPAGVLLTRRGRYSGLTTAVAGVCTVLLPILAVGWWAVRAGRVETGLVPLLTVTTAATALVSFSVWARSLHLFADGERRPLRDWPRILTDPWLAGLYGFVAPGAAQVVAQRPGRAVLTLWSAWPFAASVVLLLQAPLIWGQREGFARWGLDVVTLEKILMVGAALALLAPLFWIAQSLEGARAVAAAGGRWSTVRGDWSAVALAVCLGAAAVIAKPQMIAAGLSTYAETLAAHECVVAPVTLAQAARRLDPGEPAYPLQVADYHLAAGDEAAARRVRSELDRTMQAYREVLAREQRETRAAAASQEAAQRELEARAARAAMFLAPPGLSPVTAGGPPEPGAADPPRHSRP